MRRAQQHSADSRVAEFNSFWQIGPSLIEALSAFEPEISEVLAEFDESFYVALFEDLSIEVLMRDAAIRKRAIAAMTAHWRQILTAEPCVEALEGSAEIGKRHSEFGITERQFLFTCEQVLQRIVRAISKSSRRDADHAAAVEAVLKVALGHAEIALTAYRESAASLAALIELRRGTKALRNQVHSLEAIAYIDKLTGLFNRRYFDQALTKEIARARRSNRPLCLVMADLDHFKTVNDLHGHAAGDVVLHELGKTLLQVARQSDVCARIGGEEFAVILPDTPPDHARMFAERLRKRLAERQIKIDKTKTISVTASLGISILGASDTAKELCANADHALYQAKRDGRNQSVILTDPTSPN